MSTMDSLVLFVVDASISLVWASTSSQCSSLHPSRLSSRVWTYFLVALCVFEQRGMFVGQADPLS